MAGLAALLAMAVLAWWAWRSLPHPTDGGLLVLTTAAALATAALFRTERRGRLFWPRALMFAAVVLAVQAAMQVAAVAGLVG